MMPAQVSKICTMSAPASIRGAVRSLLEWFGDNPGHIFNLGHGILPDVPPDHAREMVRAVKEESAALRAQWRAEAEADAHADAAAGTASDTEA
jgi:hypothetical protein